MTMCGTPTHNYTADRQQWTLFFDHTHEVCYLNKLSGLETLNKYLIV